jgi:chemotaxis protein methyltransferase CheR
MIDESIEHIARFVYRRSRLFFPEHKMSLFKSRLRDRLTELKLPDFAAYHAYLQHSQGEETILLDNLTTNETFFFRNQEQFRYLAEKILPETESEKGQEVVRSWGRAVTEGDGSIMKLRILCAGCSSGEEPYSVAMTVLESLRYPKAWDIEILAGDLSTSCIKTATTGFYESHRLKGIPPAYLDTYMVATARGATFNNDVKKLIKFCRLNLKNMMNIEEFPTIPGKYTGFDIIFCRNVMIYFSPEAQQQLVDALYCSLLPGGYLFTGDAEPLHLYEHSFTLVKDAGCLLYRKI